MHTDHSQSIDSHLCLSVSIRGPRLIANPQGTALKTSTGCLRTKLLWPDVLPYLATDKHKCTHITVQAIDSHLCLSCPSVVPASSPPLKASGLDRLPIAPCSPFRPLQVMVQKLEGSLAMDCMRSIKHLHFTTISLLQSMAIQMEHFCKLKRDPFIG